MQFILNHGLGLMCGAFWLVSFAFVVSELLVAPVSPSE